MTIIDMLQQSGVLTLLGMGIVFCFLIIMIIVISRMGKIMSGKKNTSADTPVGGAQSAAPAAGNNGAVIAAISAAVNEYRKPENR